jgi:hypothetical protein
VLTSVSPSRRAASMSAAVHLSLAREGGAMAVTTVTDTDDISCSNFRFIPLYAYQRIDGPSLVPPPIAPAAPAMDRFVMVILQLLPN